MKRASAIVIATLLLITAASAQGGPPAPGPEVKKLDFYVGNWSNDGDMKPGPMGPGGKMTVTEESKWMDGGFFVVIHSNLKSAVGNWTAIAFMGYDTNDKVYTYDEYNSMGEVVHAKGTVDGDTWNWTNEMKMGSMTMKGRFTSKIVSPTVYTYKFETSTDGKKWDLVMDGRDTKNK